MSFTRMYAIYTEQRLAQDGFAVARAGLQSDQHQIEVAASRRGAEAAGLLQVGGTDAADPLVRAATCGCIACNGVVGAAITPLHPAITRWPACGREGAEPVARP